MPLEQTELAGVNTSEEIECINTCNNKLLSFLLSNAFLTRALSKPLCDKLCHGPCVTQKSLPLCFGFLQKSSDLVSRTNPTFLDGLVPFPSMHLSTVLLLPSPPPRSSILFKTSDSASHQTILSFSVRFNMRAFVKLYCIHVSYNNIKSGTKTLF